MRMKDTRENGDETLRRAREQIKRIRCFRCGKKGHIVRDCLRDPDTSESESSEDEKPRKEKKSKLKEKAKKKTAKQRARAAREDLESASSDSNSEYARQGKEFLQRSHCVFPRMCSKE